VFAAKPRDYGQKVNRKMYRGAVRSILSELARQERLVILPDLKVEAPKTKLMAEKMQELGLAGALILVDELDENLVLAVRNLPGVDILAADEADPVSLIAFDSLVATEGAIRKLEERLS
jgi:large subunit ribosomal protein L4